MATTRNKRKAGRKKAQADQKKKRGVRRSLDDEMFHALLTHPTLAQSIVCDLLSPEEIAELDFERMEITTPEFYDETLKKRVADLVLVIPVKETNVELRVALILEHKAQSSTLENQETIAQTLLYMALFCMRQARAARAGDVLVQPIVAIVYTGPDPELDLKMCDCYILPKPLKRFQMDFPHIFVNLTKLRCQGAESLASDPFLDVAFNIMTRHTKEDFDGFEKTALDPLREVDLRGETECAWLRTLVEYFSNRVAKFDPEHVKERVRSFLRPVEEKGDEYMECATRAMNSVVLDYGVDKGRELGRKEEREQSRADIRTIIRNAAIWRFGEFTERMKQALARVANKDALMELSSFVLSADNPDCFVSRIEELED